MWGQEAGETSVSFMEMEDQIIAWTLGGKRQGGQKIKAEGESAGCTSPQQQLSQGSGKQGWGLLQAKHWGQG